MRKTLLALAMLLALPLATTACSSTDQGGNVWLITNSDEVVASGSSVAKDVVLINGSLGVQEGGTIDGDIVVVNGDLSVDGSVDGDIFSVAGDVSLGASAQVSGDVSNLFGALDPADGASVDGASGGVNAPPSIELTGPTLGQKLGAGLGASIVQALIVMLFAWLLPTRVENMRRTLDHSAGMAAGYGLLTFVVGVCVAIALIFTICGIPLSVLIFLFLWLGSVFGWTAFGAQVGEWVEGKTGSDFSLPVQSGLGAWLLFVGLALLELIPCLGVIVSIAIRAIALGVAMLSRFGGRAYPEGAEA